jgi:AraC-like DNA-binding protein
MDKDAPTQPSAQRPKDHSPVPSETANESVFATQARSFGDCYRWWLADEERRHWCDSNSPVLNTLRVFSCGLFVEAHEHGWKRSDLTEGVLIYCTEGCGGYWQDDRQWKIKPGDLFYCPPNTHHRYWADAAQPWTIYWMHLSGEMLADYEELLGFSDDSPVRHIGVHDAIIAEFTRLIIQHPLAKGKADWFRIQSNAIAILGRIAELPHNIADIAAAYGPIQKAIALMEASLGQTYDLLRFANEAGYGRRHFIRQFSTVTGVPPGVWFIRRKMQRACSLLSQPCIRVKEVASRLGYDDALYFSRVFKRVIGLPPEKYRHKMKPDSGRNAGP